MSFYCEQVLSHYLGDDCFRTRVHCVCTVVQFVSALVRPAISVADTKKYGFVRNHSKRVSNVWSLLLSGHVFLSKNRWISYSYWC